MQYLPEEMDGIEPGKDGIITILRSPGVVFSPESLASFEGKPVCINHPEELVSPETWKEVSVGTMQNVRRGSGIEDDLMLADLLVTDAEAIQLITSKKIREVSLGYDAEYEQIAPGRAEMRSMVGNHIALVERGRCGPRCKIGDEMPQEKPKKSGSGIKDTLRKFFMTRDSEEFEKALDDLPAEGEGEKEVHVHVHMPEAKEAGVTDEEINPEDDPDRKLSEVLSKLDARLTALEEAVKSIGATKDEESVEKKEEKATNDDDPDGWSGSFHGQRVGYRGGKIRGNQRQRAAAPRIPAGQSQSRDSGAGTEAADIRRQSTGQSHQGLHLRDASSGPARGHGRPER
ncbi:DUF2213 domain-containing protein [Chromobacterium haemolyticum]|nr:DUF2213 domain-containing protein [Chromobacterium haemolyticum]